MNWKPYWPSNPDVNILHFHGPKIGSIKSILGQKWNWDDAHGAQIGSLLVGHRDSYRSALLLARRALRGTEGEAMVDAVLDNFDNKFNALPRDKINLEFMNFKLFGE